LIPGSGVAVAPVGAILLALGTRLWRKLAFELRITPGIALAFSHTLAGTTLWQRGGLMLDLGAALTWNGG
jgi:hypothetical protein